MEVSIKYDKDDKKLWLNLPNDFLQLEKDEALKLAHSIIEEIELKENHIPNGMKFGKL